MHWSVNTSVCYMIAKETFLHNISLIRNSQNLFIYSENEESTDLGKFENNSNRSISQYWIFCEDWIMFKRPLSYWQLFPPFCPSSRGFEIRWRAPSFGAGMSFFIQIEGKNIFRIIQTKWSNILDHGPVLVI